MWALYDYRYLQYRQFEILSESGEKVGEPSKALAEQLAAMQSQKEDTSCGFAEEGQSEADLAVSQDADDVEHAGIELSSAKRSPSKL
jgi:hypothetical protein